MAVFRKIPFTVSAYQEMVATALLAEVLFATTSTGECLATGIKREDGAPLTILAIPSLPPQR